MIVLDTHAWLWWCSNPKELSSRARHALAQETELGVSAISCWEVAMLVQRGRLGLDRDVLSWIRHALAVPPLSLIPLSPEIAVQAAELDSNFPGDPADRLIAGTALVHHAKVVTKDRRIRSFKAVPTVW